MPKSRSKHSKVNQKSAEVVKSKTNEDKADKDEHKKNNKKKKVVLEKVTIYIRTWQDKKLLPSFLPLISCPKS